MDKDTQPRRVLYQNPDRKPAEKREQFNAKLPPSTRAAIKALVASGQFKSEADAIVSAIALLSAQQPVVAVLAQTMRDLLEQQANELYYAYPDAEQMPSDAYQYYTWLMRVDGELEQFLLTAQHEGANQ